MSGYQTAGAPAGAARDSGIQDSTFAPLQESLELVLDAARDRRLVLFETAVVVLILFEIAISLLRPH